MILTICPNPSIDCTIELDSLNVGKLNRIDNKVETYSGKALNVAIGVARLGGKPLATGFMFNGHKTLFENVLESEGVKHDFVYNEGAARVNYKIIDKKSMLTEINDRGTEVSVDKQKKLLEKIKTNSLISDIAVISGSLPKGTAPSFYGDMVEAVNENAKVIVDTEKDNMECAIGKREIFMVKPNLDELEKFSCMQIKTKADMVKAGKKYIDKGVKYVLISLGKEGAVLTDGNTNYYCTSTNVAVNSTVGAGDSMISAYSMGLLNGEPNDQLLKMAVAAGTAAVTTSGTNLFYKDKYSEILNKISVEKF